MEILKVGLATLFKPTRLKLTVLLPRRLDTFWLAEEKGIILKEY